MPTTHFCVHGHFYQPPREDPFTGEIPNEYGAGSYSNWTERIFNECYQPNAQVGNFQKISFNIGATLLVWMEKHHPETLKSIIKQESLVFQRTGVSNAMVQPYFHLIMPLASERDRNTMIRWGIKDYEKRFGHEPKGLWLPETAVDKGTLQALADHGIQFTILAPWQAKNPQLDTTQPYRVQLDNNKEIIVFFYNAFLSGEISFNPSASENADTFVHDWLLPQSELLQRGHEQLIMVATDGELYGHHQLYREKFLSYLMDGAVEKTGIEHYFPALWLRDHTVTQTAEIMENTSWSCHHGIERWRNVCGDAPSATWKKPVRDFLNGLADAIDTLYEIHLRDLVHDPWKLRDAYIDVLLGTTSLDDLLASHAITTLDSTQQSFVTTLLEAQFDRLRMFSSDAWFFYDLDRIETLNTLKYAAHATGLVELATGINPAYGSIDILARAHSEVSSLTGDVAFLGYLKKFEMLRQKK
ncbi:MAG TPA: glycoside hydrolase [Anaerolineaceae bacterium]|nr:glycoside hydrolase [Anaerolineaceae bacterium]